MAARGGWLGAGTVAIAVACAACAEPLGSPPRGADTAARATGVGAVEAKQSRGADAGGASSGDAAADAAVVMVGDAAAGSEYVIAGRIREQHFARTPSGYGPPRASHCGVLIGDRTVAHTDARGRFRVRVRLAGPVEICADLSEPNWGVPYHDRCQTVSPGDAGATLSVDIVAGESRDGEL